jgi:hypothetical protein
MPSWLDLYGPLIVQAAGNEVPLAMLLGHVQLESGGKPHDVTKLDERGLFQIHPGTSKEMGFDHGRMFEPAYNIWAGIEMFRRMADRMQRDFPQLFPARGDLFWRMVRFEFAIGSGATRQILRTMLGQGIVPRSWPEFTAYLERNRDALFRLVKHDPVKWANSVNRVFETGQRLLAGGLAVGGSVLLIALLAAAGALVLWTRRTRSPPGQAGF